MASHLNVNALDLEGCESPAEMELLAAENLKRVIRAGSYDRNMATGSLSHILDLMEIKTVWHPKGH
jgi:hypothetical protein